MAPPGFVDKRNVSRRPTALLPVVLLVIGAAAAGVGSAADDPTYKADNARLAHATPAYPSARLLVDEPIWGVAGSTPFEAVQRVYRLAAPSTQAGSFASTGGDWGTRGALEGKRASSQAGAQSWRTSMPGVGSES